MAGMGHEVASGRTQWGPGASAGSLMGEGRVLGSQDWCLPTSEWKKVKVLDIQCVWHFVIPGTVAHQPALSMGFSGQEYRSGLPFSLPGDLPDQGLNPHLSCMSSTLAAKFFTTHTTWEAASEARSYGHAISPVGRTVSWGLAIGPRCGFWESLLWGVEGPEACVGPLVCGPGLVLTC